MLGSNDSNLIITFEALPLLIFNVNPIIIINSLSFTTFFLTGLSGYLLAYYYTRNKHASLLAGLIYGFSAYHFSQWGHINTASVQFIPLSVIALEELLKKPGAKSTVLFMISFFICALVSFYHVILGIIPLCIIISVRLWQYRKDNQTVKRLFSLVISGLSLVILVLPFILPIFQASQDHNIVRSVFETEGYSASPKDLFYSVPNNLWFQTLKNVFGQTTIEYYHNEHDLYIGIFVPLLVLLSAFLLLKKNKNFRRFWQNEKTFLIFILIALTSFIFALGPTIAKIPLPYLLLYKYIPIYKSIRVPTRVFFYLLLACSVILAYLIKQFDLPTKRNKIFIFLIFLSIIVEQSVVPLQLTSPQNLNTDLYSWIGSNSTQNTVIFNYPMGGVYEYLRGSELIKQSSINGFGSFYPEAIYRLKKGTDSSEFREKPLTYLQVLADLDVKYFIIHPSILNNDDQYRQLLAGLENTQGVSLAININGDGVYDIGVLKAAPINPVRTKSFALLLNPSQYVLLDINNTETLYINKSQNKYSITMNFKKNGKTIATTKKEFLRPLYLLPGEIYRTKVDLNKPFLVDYDKIDFMVD
jgi:hypothetical protein